jgi:hypothetical protein
MGQYSCPALTFVARESASALADIDNDGNQGHDAGAAES